jgi:UDP-N-acetylmuramate-alanine ligase
MIYPNSICIPDFTQAVKFLLDRLVPGDVLVVLSAGDADQISARVVEQLKERSKAGD